MAMNAFGKYGGRSFSETLAPAISPRCAQHAAVEANKLDRRRTFWNFQRLDRRQMRADPDNDADDRDCRPQAEHRAPVEQPSDAKNARATSTGAWRRLSYRAACARAAARRHRFRVCAWRMISSAVVVGRDAVLWRQP